MVATTTSDARELLHRLESHWLSLLRWLSEEQGISPDDLISRLGPGAARASENFVRESGRSTQAGFTLLHFVDFNNYVEIANQHRRQLEHLGDPPRRWTDMLAEQNRRGLVRYRNHLAHANRFERLPITERQQVVTLLQEQTEHLRAWWPECPFEDQAVPPEPPSVRSALRLLGDDPKDAAALAEELGLRPVANPLNLVPSGETTPLAETLRGYAGRLYRVGEANLATGSAGLYLVYLDQWDDQASKRERYRRRVARALIEYAPDARWLAILLDADGQSSEVELLLPRAQGTVRATVAPQDPTRYHIELLESLRISPGITLSELSRRWTEAFSVEKVTRRFFEEFRGLRDRLVAALLAANPENPALAGKDPEQDPAFELQLNAFGTRQLSRVLFMWFLQQKRWLGGHPGDGSETYLIDLFREHAGDDNYFADVLVPILFDGLGRPLHDDPHEAVAQRFGTLPYLDGGLFRADADPFERELFDAGPDGRPRRPVVLPDDLFNPAKDAALLVAPGRHRAQARDRTVLGLLRGYRFTTQESTPDDQSVDPDPELLGKVFENLYQADDRHQTGAYYTPREIVRYMCRQALDGYLRDTAGVEQALIDRIRQEAADWEAEKLELSDARASALIRALERVTILDPAVGSGAFLVGSLQEIILLRRGIEQGQREQDVERSSKMVAEWKKHAITHNLYGVDINPMAVEICRLRLWLSLVIDLDKDAVPLTRDIPALPNLDFRIVAGDSLIDRMGETRFYESLPLIETQVNFEVEAKLREIERLQHEFELVGERGNVQRMHESAARITETRLGIVGSQIDAAIQKSAGERKKLARSGRPSKRATATAKATLTSLQTMRDGLQPDAPFQKPLLWPLVFPEVFRGNDETGFDIVLANPPYVRQESLNAIDQTAYGHAFKEVHTGTADILVYFFNRAIQLLRPGGRIAFITSNKYMRAAYGAGLREYLPNALQITEVIDFGDLPLFDVAAYPAVVIGKRDEAADPAATVQAADLVYPIRRQLIEAGQPVNPDNVRLALEALPALIATAKAPDYPHALLRREGWILEDPTLVRLFDRLMNEGTPLGEYVNGRMYRGVLTGLNAAFVIDQATRDALIAADPRSAGLIKPWLRGRDIKRWHANWAGLYVIFTRRGTDIEQYPAIKRHLSQWREELEPKQPGDPKSKKGRKPGDYKWFEIQDNVAYYQEFEQPKVIWPDITPNARFLWDGEGFFTDTTIFQAVGLSMSHLALLNSSLSEFLLA